jgi:hypothetical protein
MDNRVYVIAAIIIVAGAAGGYAAYLAEPEQSPPESKSKTLSRALLLGVLAAACVPLFLSLVQSGLIRTIFAPGSPPSPPAFEEYLIFMGLCVVAAVSSRSFIASVTEKVLQQAKEARAIAVEAKKTAEKTADEVELGESADEPNAPPPVEAETAAAVEGPSRSRAGEIDDLERKALDAMLHRTYRTRTGIAEDSGISKNRISEILEGLAAKKLALRTTSPTTGGQRWIITNRGRAALGEVS